MDIADYVNELPPSARIGNLSDYLVEQDLHSPSDMFQSSVSAILQYGTQDRLLDSDFLGRILVTGIVSAVEAYFRSMMSTCIELCPIAQSVASKQNILLGGLLWHGREGFSRSAFEHSAFTSKEEIANACRKFLGFNMEDQIFKVLLDEYETVCQLRHGIVHGDGLLPGRNAIQLNIPRYKRPVRIVVRYEKLQEVTAVANTLTMTFNRKFFEFMCKRWAVDWRKRADWDATQETIRFRALWKLFHCTEETKRRKGRSKITMKNCLTAVRTHYNL